MYVALVGELNLSETPVVGWVSIESDRRLVFTCVDNGPLLRIPTKSMPDVVKGKCFRLLLPAINLLDHIPGKFASDERLALDELAYGDA